MSRAFQIPFKGTSRYDELIKQDEEVQSEVNKEFSKTFNSVESLSFKINCLKSGITFMNRCGQHTRHKAMIKNNCLVLLKHEKSELNALEAMSALASLGSDQIDKCSPLLNCFIILKGWREARVNKVPDPMLPYLHYYCVDDIRVEGRRLLRVIQNKLDKRLRLKHDPKSISAGGDEALATKYVALQLRKLGFNDIELKARNGLDADKPNVILSINGFKFFMDLYYSCNYKRLYLSYRGGTETSVRTSEILCPDCSIESLAADILGSLYINHISKEHNDSYAKISDMYMKEISDSERAKDIRLEKISVHKSSDFHINRTNAHRTYCYECIPIDNRNYSTFYKSSQRENIATISIPIPFGNKGTVKFAMSKLQKLIEQLNTVHPELNIEADKDAKCKLGEIIC